MCTQYIYEYIYAHTYRHAWGDLPQVDEGAVGQLAHGGVLGAPQCLRERRQPLHTVAQFVAPRAACVQLGAIASVRRGIVRARGSVPESV